LCQIGKSEVKETVMDWLNELAADFCYEGDLQACAVPGQIPETQWDKQQQQQKSSLVLSPRANYTD
jgi:hypothetical protein